MAYTVFEMAKLALASYDAKPTPVGGWLPVEHFGEDAMHGFFAVLYRESDTHYVLAIRGTDDWQMDPIDDALVFAGRVSAQMGQAHKALERSKRRLAPNSVLCLTGHSLGGGLAALLAADTRFYAVTFNAPGTARSYGEVYAARYEIFPPLARMLALTAPYAAYTNRILNLRASWDAVSMGTGPRLGRVQSLDVRGCAPIEISPPRQVGGRPFGSGPAAGTQPAQPDIWDALGEPDLFWALKSYVEYMICQHGMARMLAELDHHPEYKRDLKW
jgi:hypothetical protein